MFGATNFIHEIQKAVISSFKIFGFFYHPHSILESIDFRNSYRVSKMSSKCFTLFLKMM
jgi:hypothetical protein